MTSFFSRKAGVRVLGIAFVLVLAMLVSLSIAFYRKSFTPVVHVTLRATSAGYQLNPGADVKIRGLIVGEVRKIRSSGDGADVELALKPDLVDQIPANVTARLLPKTLFGARYVSLVVPNAPSPDHLSEGGTVDQDASHESIEVDQVLSDLLPLLQAVPPEKLDATLAALSTALSGRGNKLGDTLVKANAYLVQINPQLNQVVADLANLGKTAEVYNSAAPDLFAVLDNLRTTDKTLTEQQQALAASLQAGKQLGDTTQPFLAENADRLIKVNTYSKPTLEVLAAYAPEYSCFLTGMATLTDRLNTAFGVGTNQPGLHATIEIIQDRGKYQTDEKPKNFTGAGSDCRGLPNPPVPFPVPNIDDGTHGQFGTGTGQLGKALSSGIGDQGSDAENRLVKSLIGLNQGVTPDKVDDGEALLLAPLVRGSEVTLS